MTNQEILNELIECKYEPEYICLAFMLNGEYYSNWFNETIQNNKRYKFIKRAITTTIVDDFIKTMNDTVNLNKYFAMRRVIERAEIYKAKLHRIELYSRVMKVDLGFAFYIYLENEREAEKDLWNKIYEESIGENYREKYPYKSRKLPKAYYIDKDGLAKNIRYEQSRKQFYLYGYGVRYK